MDVSNNNYSIFSYWSWKILLNLLDLSSIKVGAKIPVYIDPNNEKNILLVYG